MELHPVVMRGVRGTQERPEPPPRKVEIDPRSIRRIGVDRELGPVEHRKIAQRDGNGQPVGGEGEGGVGDQHRLEEAIGGDAGIDVG